MKVADIFTEMKQAAKVNVKVVGFVYYIPFVSKNALTRLSKLVDKFESDSDLDCELGIISHEDHIKELAMVKMMRDSITACYERNY